MHGLPPFATATMMHTTWCFFLPHANRNRCFLVGREAVASPTGHRTKADGPDVEGHDRSLQRQVRLAPRPSQQPGSSQPVPGGAQVPVGLCACVWTWGLSLLFCGMGVECISDVMKCEGCTCKKSEIQKSRIWVRIRDVLKNALKAICMSSFFSFGFAEWTASWKNVESPLCKQQFWVGNRYRENLNEFEPQT